MMIVDWIVLRVFVHVLREWTFVAVGWLDLTIRSLTLCRPAVFMITIPMQKPRDRTQ